MYQTIKSIIAMAPVMNRDGVLVLYSDCTEGTDSPDMLHPFEEGRGPEGALDFLNENYKIQMDHSLLLCKILKTGLRIVFHSPNISPDIPSMMGLIPAESPEDALEKARQLAGKNSKVAFIPCPQRALPFVVQ
jgi:nickel-dependent lactate racemase